jgi:large subunit ribosomal protein L28
MSRVCQVTGKAPMVGTMFPTPTTRPSAAFCPTCSSRRFWIETENRWVRLRVSNAGLRTIDKKGIDVVLAELRARGEASNSEEKDHGQKADAKRSSWNPQPGTGHFYTTTKNKKTTPESWNS